jgi:hypothetical protein
MDEESVGALTEAHLVLGELGLARDPTYCISRWEALGGVVRVGGAPADRSEVYQDGTLANNDKAIDVPSSHMNSASPKRQPRDTGPAKHHTLRGVVSADEIHILVRYKHTSDGTQRTLAHRRTSRLYGMLRAG